MPVIQFDVQYYRSTMIARVRVVAPTGLEYFVYGMNNTYATIVGSTASFRLDQTSALNVELSTYGSEHSKCPVSGHGCFGVTLGNPLWGSFNNKSSDAIGQWTAYLSVVEGGVTTYTYPTALDWRVIAMFPLEP